MAVKQETRRETRERAGWRPTVEGTVGHRKTEQKRASEKKESVGREYREKLFLSPLSNFFPRFRHIMHN